MLADGYISDTELENLPAFPSSNLPCTTAHALREDPAFITDESGVRWHRTNDLGHLDPASGTLTVLGRADDVILSGGLNIVPSHIESALTGRYGIGQACVVGVPDPHWGHKVVAVVTQSGADLAPLDQIRGELTATLGKGYGPRAFITVDQLPLTDSGKPDRRQVERIAQAMTANQPARSLRK
jgi:O-succinylbenzoic acid--CoA ligase